MGGWLSPVNGAGSREFEAVRQGLREPGYVDKLLRGARPAELPIEQPTVFDFVLSLKTAQALGLTIPPSVLAHATEVIR